jgi:hypothetical protein
MGTKVIARVDWAFAIGYVPTRPSRLSDPADLSLKYRSEYY